MSTKLTLATYAAATDARLDRLTTLLEAVLAAQTPAAPAPAAAATPAPVKESPATPVTEALSKSKAKKILLRAHPERHNAPKTAAVWHETHEGVTFVIASTLEDAKGALLGACPLTNTSKVELEWVGRPYKQTSAWLVRKGTAAQVDAYTTAASQTYAPQAANLRK